MTNLNSIHRLTIRLRANHHLLRIVSIMIACSIFYYLPSLAGMIGWVSLQDALNNLHDFYGLVFFAPVVYAAYVFGVKGATLTALITILILLPYNCTAASYSENIFRSTAFAIILSAVGSAVALIQRSDEKHRRSINELKQLHDVGKMADLSDSVEDFLRSVAALIPRAIRCPSSTQVKIQVGNKEVMTPAFGRGTIASLVTVPLHARGMPPGVLKLQCPPQHRINPEELALLQSIADQIAVGIANAELHQETRANVEQLALMGEISRIVAAGQNINDIYHAFSMAISKFIQFDQASLHLTDENNKNMTIFTVARDSSVDSSTETTFKLAGTGTEWVVRSRKPHIENDMQTEQAFPSDSYLITRGFRSTIRLPLMAGGRVLGTFNLRSNTPYTYGDRERTLLEQPLGQLAVAIDNAALVSYIKAHEEHLEESSEALQAAQRCVLDAEKRIRFIAGTASCMMDDFNSVVTTIIRRIQQAIYHTEDSYLRDSLHIIEQSALDAARTVRRLKDSATQNLPNGSEITDINAMVSNAMYCDSRPRLQNRGKNGNGSKTATPTPSPVDSESETEIKKAVLNILVNAMGANSGVTTEIQRIDEPDTAGIEHLSAAIQPVAMVDLKGKLVYANTSFLNMWGYNDETEVLGEPEVRFWQEAEHISSPGITPSEQTSWQGESVAVRKDGTTFDVQLSASLVSEIGRPICTRVSFIDITKRKQAEREIKHTFERLRIALEETVSVLTSVVEKRYPGIAVHQQKVARLARAITTEMGLPEKQIYEIWLAATLHDIGKINMPAPLIEDSDHLTDLEAAALRTHPQAGYEMVKVLPFDGPIAQIIQQHHELLDGSGYPAGISGDGIHLGARIITVADAVVNATAKCCRAGVGLREALDDIRNNRGVLYDAQVVDACLRLIMEKGFTLDRALREGNGRQ